MPKGVYDRAFAKPGTGNTQEVRVPYQYQADERITALEARIAALERRQAQMDEAFAKGYMPSPGGLIGGSRGP